MSKEATQTEGVLVSQFLGRYLGRIEQDFLVLLKNSFPDGCMNSYSAYEVIGGERFDHTYVNVGCIVEKYAKRSDVINAAMSVCEYSKTLISAVRTAGASLLILRDPPEIEWFAGINDDSPGGADHVPRVRLIMRASFAKLDEYRWVPVSIPVDWGCADDDGVRKLFTLGAALHAVP